MPDKSAADAVTVFLHAGDRHVINNWQQVEADSGTNVAASATGASPVVVTGAHGTAIGSQTASGEKSSLVGSQAVHSDNNAVTGRDATTAATEDGSKRATWWTRMRKRGPIFDVFTLIGGAVAMLTWIGWTPWS